MTYGCFSCCAEKRDNRRKEINRPRRSIQFALENNQTREFKINDVVQRDDKVIKSALRNQPRTKGRLVKLPSTLETDLDHEDSKTGAPSKPATSKDKPPEAGAPSSDEILETMSAQSGASSN